MSPARIIRRLSRLGSVWLCSLALCLSLSFAAYGATYYVGPKSTNNHLSTNSASPGTLSYAVANAPSGSTVILKAGTYNAAPNGFFVANSNVTFESASWHGAIIENTTGSNLWTSTGPSANNDVMQGMVFGPSTGLGFSGGPNGGSGWQFLDCEFISNGGFEVGNNGLFERCLFTDDYSNSFDLGGTNQSMIDCVVRRGNRVSADDDGVGNKEDYTTNFTVDDLVDYDNNGAALWFDTDNDGWLIENSTFFGNHGGNNWYYGTVGSGTSTTQFTCYGQDGQGISVGQPILGLSGANQGYTSTITAVSGYNPQTITVSPALHAIPGNNDQFAIQQDSASAGDGFITEANDNGTFTNNVVYSNTDAGYFDHSSGGSAFGGTGGLVVENNLFAYNAESFFVWSDQRDQGPATVEYNQFKFLPGTTSAFDSWGSTPGAYPYLGQITFDYNDYNPDTDDGDWAVWYTNYPPPTAGGLTAGSQPSGQDYLQNPSTWNQDYHSNTDAVPFWGVAPAVYVWPAGSDTNWSDDYFPNNTFGLSNSIHQIDDTDGAVTNTIDSVIDSLKAGSIITIPVVAHTPLSGDTCKVYDLNGRWVTLTVEPSEQARFISSVPPYVTCAAGNATQTYKIRVLLNAVTPYSVTATYDPITGGSVAGSVTTASTSLYKLAALGTLDWAHWNGTYNHKAAGGGKISNVTQTAGGTFGTYHTALRNVQWTGGTPVATNSDDQYYIWCNGTTGQGWTFTVPAGTVSRTVNILCGGGPGAAIKLNAHLSDNSAADYTDTETVAASPYTYLYTITFNAASASKTLIITLTKNDTNPDISVDLDAAWMH